MTEENPSDLLRVGTFRAPRGAKSSIPLIMEFSINPETGPFLVTSSRTLLWINPRQPKVRAASRPLEPSTLFADVVREVAEMGAASQWGNVHAFTPAGFQDAVAHVRSYDMGDVDALVHSSTDMTKFPTTRAVDGGWSLFGVPLVQSDWMAPDMLAVVPKDRAFVGFLLLVDERGLAVVHNTSRSLGVCRG